MSVGKTKKSIKGKKLMDMFSELARPNVTVSRMLLKVLDDGTVVIEDCEYEEEST